MGHCAFVTGVLSACAAGSMLAAPTQAQALRASHAAPIGNGQPRIMLAPQLNATEGGGVFPGNCEFFDPFTSYTLTDLTNVPASFLPLDKQLNPGGIPWDTRDFFGAANSAVILAGGAQPPTGAPPHGVEPMQYGMAARTFGSTYNPKLGLLGDTQHAQFIPATDTPVMVSQDFYIESTDGQPRTTVWWSPVSFVTLSIWDRVFFGGTNLQGDLAGFGNAQGVTDRFLSLGRAVGGVGESFYASAPFSVFDFPVNQWFTLMAHTSVGQPSGGGYSLWLKCADSVAADPPYIDPRLASGDITPIDGEAQGWVNLYPGRGDNLATPQVREGIGMSRDRFGNFAPNNGQFGQAPIFDQPGFNGVQYGWGFDDPLNPGFQPNNYYFANYCVTGEFIQIACPADFDGNGVVGGEDLAEMLANWGPDGGFTPVDLTVDGDVNGADLAELLADWGSCF